MCALVSSNVINYYVQFGKGEDLYTPEEYKKMKTKMEAIREDWTYDVFEDEHNMPCMDWFK